jgi:hypothetical protein
VSREDVVAVASRIFAVYLVFVVIRTVPGLVLGLRQELAPGLPILIFGSLLLVLAAAAVFWLFPITVARKLLPVMKEQRTETAMSSPIAWSLAISVVGLWYLADALVDASYWIVLLVWTSQIGFDSTQFTPEQVAGATSTGVRLVLACVLLLGSNGIRALVFRLRYGRSGDGF